MVFNTYSLSASFGRRSALCAEIALGGSRCRSFVGEASVSRMVVVCPSRPATRRSDNFFYLPEPTAADALRRGHRVTQLVVETTAALPSEFARMLHALDKQSRLSPTSTVCVKQRPTSPKFPKVAGQERVAKLPFSKRKLRMRGKRADMHVHSTCMFRAFRRVAHLSAILLRAPQRLHIVCRSAYRRRHHPGQGRLHGLPREQWHARVSPRAPDGLGPG